MVDEVIHLPPFPLPAKPAYKSPCNGCGWCCHEEVCTIGCAFYETTVAPCPGITFVDGKVRCGVVLQEDKILAKHPDIKPLRRVRNMLGIESYCDSKTVEEMENEA